MNEPLVLHAGCVAVTGATIEHATEPERGHGSELGRQPAGVLILGPSGVGKSCFALRMLALGARLVADDRTVLSRRGAALWAEAPAAIRGLIEARGVGLLRLPALETVELRLVVELAPPGVNAQCSRLPPRRFVTYLGVRAPLLRAENSEALAAVALLLARGGELLDPDGPSPCRRDATPQTEAQGMDAPNADPPREAAARAASRNETR